MKKSQFLKAMPYRAHLVGMALLALAVSGCTNMENSMDDDSMSRDATQRMVEDWPEASQSAVMATMERYGTPSGITPSMIVWENSGPFKRTIAYREPIQHDFPMPHPDVLETVINYQVPPEMFDELAMYDGSVIVERTKGEMSARCDKEPLNILALNLAHEIVIGEKTVEEARMTFGEQAMAFKAGRSAPYTESLMFTPPSDAAANDPGQALSMSRSSN